MQRRQFLSLAAATAGLSLSQLEAAERTRSQPPPRPRPPSKKLGVVTTAKDDNGARELLKAFGVPFRQGA